MGIVFEAEQTEPMTRRVALKVIKLGMDTKQVVARFEAERQALAVMNHPGIAKVYDAGATEDGRPFFAMERVAGIPLAEYCDTNKLSTKDRIALVIDLCHAIQHAHQKGVIHRDLKPSNVLVSEQDRRPMPKVIDFGIAKAVGRRLSNQTLVTEYGQAIGTPAYMSPEQAEMSALDVDTRTDIYSLGVMLFELLVGSLPVDPEAIGLPGFVAQLVLRETDPPTPSARLRSLDGNVEDLAALRRTDAITLRRQLRGDLDWIAMKALEPDRSRRYETANALAMDLERYLANEPVVARPPSVSYRVGKFVRRNRLGVALGGGLAVTVVAFAVVMAVQAKRIAVERDRAEQEATTAQQVTDFLTGLFSVSAPSEARGNTITAREILDRGVEQIGEDLADQPIVQGRLLEVMGAVHTGLGLYGDAERLLKDALDVRRRNLGAEHPDVGVSLNRLAWLYRSQWRLDEALPLAEEAVVILRAAAEPNDTLLAMGLQTLGMVQRDLGDFEVARQSLEESLDIRRRAGGPNHVSVGWSLYHLGWLAYREGKYAQARERYEEALPILEAGLEPGNPWLAWALNDFAVVMRELQEPDEAKALYERALSIMEHALDPDHPDLAAIVNNYAVLLWQTGDLSGAQRQYERSLRIREKAFGPDHVMVAATLNNLGLVFQSTGDYVAAREHLTRSLRIYETAGSDPMQSINTLGSLGGLLRYIGDTDAALPVLQRTLDIQETALGPEHPDLIDALTELGFLYRDRGQLESAVTYLDRARHIAEDALGADHLRVAHLSLHLAAVHARSGDFEAADPLLERALSMDRGTSAQEQRTVAQLQLELGKVRRAQGDAQASDSMFQQALATLAAADGAMSQGYHVMQARAWATQGDVNRALSSLNRAVELGYDDPELLRMSEFTTLRGNPDYERIADGIRAKVAPAMAMP
jgi:non-specific serine/threonine protein kinase/serine/threonine-protein kinase